MRALFVILTFTRQDLIEKYSGSILGSLWSLLMPLVNILIFTIIFSKIMGARLSVTGLELDQYNYSLYLVSALLAWNCFAASVTRTTTIYQDKAGIISKVNIGLRTLPVYILLSETIIYIISMVFFIAFALIVGHSFGWAVLALPVLFLIQQIIAYSLGLIAATFSVFIRDIRELVTILFHVWFWLTPIVYVINILPDSLSSLMSFNPAIGFIKAYRDIILMNQPPELGFMLTASLVALGLFAFAQYINKHLQSDIRDFI